MKKILALMAAAAVTVPLIASASPQQDVKLYQKYFLQKFPSVPLQEFANGVYAVDEAHRENWEAIEEFPPYDPMIDEGKAMWNKPFANGKSYKSCFGKPGVANKYPYWDAKKGMVMTLVLAVNECRTKNGEKPLAYKKGPLAKLLAYMAFQSRGKVNRVKIPRNDPRALAAYEKGKQFYFARRGQLNFSCASCHMQNAGQKIRAEVISPSLGQSVHWPVYRSKWGELGTLHWRFQGCNKQVRAKPFKPQSEEYRDLEYFLAYMSNGIKLNGPAARQ